MPGNVVSKPQALVTDYPRMTIKHLVFLKYMQDKARPVHGAEIIRAFNLNNGIVYPTLNKMAEDGLLIRKRVVVKHEPDRFVYRPTHFGSRMAERVLDLLMRGDELPDEPGYEYSLG